MLPNWGKGEIKYLTELQPDVETSHSRKSRSYQSVRLSQIEDRDMLGDVQHRSGKIGAVIIQSTNKLDKEQGEKLYNQSH